MARKIKEIQDQMSAELIAAHPNLSKSATAEWTLFLYVIAVAIHTFEVILSMFRSEIDASADKITPGTARWYAMQCKGWQYGHTILFDDKTAELYYETDDPSSQIIKVVAVSEGSKTLSIKVAKFDEQEKIIQLSEEEKYDFTNYIDAIKFAGIETNVVTAIADLIKYEIEVYYEPSIPISIINNAIKNALDEFRSSLLFDSKFYKQRLIDRIMSVHGVVTVGLAEISRKGADTTNFVVCGVADELHSGYFDYDADSDFKLISTATTK